MPRVCNNLLERAVHAQSKSSSGPACPHDSTDCKGELKKPVRKCFKQNQTEKIILRRKRELLKCNLK